MTEQQTFDQPALPPPPPPAPVEEPRPRRTVGLRVLVASTVGAFVIGTLVGGGFGALIGYVAHPDGPGDRPANFQQQDFPQRPGFDAEQLPEGQSNS